MKTIVEILSEELNQKEEYVSNVVNLLDEGNTVPFIARYRKEMHGAMDDQAIRTLADRLQYLRNLEARRGEVKTSIENQGKLTEELAEKIENAATLAEVEDLYRPYKQKRRTRASQARERGLSPWRRCCLPRGRIAPIRWRRRLSMWIRKRVWRLPRTPWQAPGTSSRKTSPTMRPFGRASGNW